MSQAPSQMSDFGNPTGPVQEPERTSILALLSMISSLVCCIPGLSILGTFMGIGALISIGGSNGRVGGRGMAWTGVIVGILVTMLWIGFALGGAGVWSSIKVVIEQVSEKFVAMERADYDTARELLTAQAASATADADFEAFVQAYQRDYGSLGSLVLDLGPVTSSFGDNGPVFQRYSGSAMMPLVYETSGGTVTFVIVASQADLQQPSNPDNPFIGGLSQISFLAADGSVVELVP